ncbi:MAG TPA: hypothetical protein PLD80_07935 [Rugosibacter sp.]|nr:hypothetical protein [Rugosibacter sp.]
MSLPEKQPQNHNAKCKFNFAYLTSDSAKSKILNGFRFLVKQNEPLSAKQHWRTLLESIKKLIFDSLHKESVQKTYPASFLDNTKWQ